MEPKLSKSLQDANYYLEKNKIEKTVSDVVNTAVQKRGPNPIITMIKYLASITPSEVLKDQGIIIRHND